MNLNNIIVHKLDKQAQGNASLELRANVLPNGDKEVEFITNVKQAYYRKSNPNYGVFNANAGAYPFQTLLRTYADDNSQFYQFTENAMNHLLGIINAVPQAVRENRSFIIYGTGHDINDIENLTYIDTYQVGFMLDILVFHLFEIVS